MKKYVEEKELGGKGYIEWREQGCDLKNYVQEQGSVGRGCIHVERAATRQI